METDRSSTLSKAAQAASRGSGCLPPRRSGAARRPRCWSAAWARRVWPVCGGCETAAARPAARKTSVVSAGIGGAFQRRPDRSTDGGERSSRGPRREGPELSRAAARFGTPVWRRWRWTVSNTSRGFFEVYGRLAHSEHGQRHRSARRLAAHALTRLGRAAMEGYGGGGGRREVRPAGRRGQRRVEYDRPRDRARGGSARALAALTEQQRRSWTTDV